MFKKNEKKEILRQVKNETTIQVAANQELVSSAEYLHSIRSLRCSEALSSVELIVNDLSNSPKEFDASFSILKYELDSFKLKIKNFEKMNSDFTPESVGIAGAVAGAGFAAAAPTAAMAIATTFGTASTGTAIASLSGAAASNAALAWLGGGALAVGGGGMASGNALLALAGPVGWGIAGVGIVGGGLLLRKKNNEIIDAAKKEIIKIEKAVSDVNILNKKIKALSGLTENTANKLIESTDFYKNCPSDYSEFSKDQKEQLGAVINNANALSQLIKQEI